MVFEMDPWRPELGAAKASKCRGPYFRVASPNLHSRASTVSTAHSVASHSASTQSLVFSLQQGDGC